MFHMPHHEVSCLGACALTELLKRDNVSCEELTEGHTFTVDSHDITCLVTKLREHYLRSRQRLLHSDSTYDVQSL